MDQGRAAHEMNHPTRPPDVAGSPVHPTTDLAQAAVDTARAFAALVGQLRQRPEREAILALAAVMEREGEEYPIVRFDCRALECLWLRAAIARRLRLPMRIRNDSGDTDTIALIAAGQIARFEEGVAPEALHEDPQEYAGLFGALHVEDTHLAISAAGKSARDRTRDEARALDHALGILCDIASDGFRFDGSSGLDGETEVLPLAQVHCSADQVMQVP